MPSKSISVNVVPAATARFVFSTPSSVVAGTPLPFSVTAEDPFGNVETGYTGTVHFNAEAQDTQATVRPITRSRRPTPAPIASPRR